MAEIIGTKRVDVTFKIPLEQNVAPTSDGRVRLSMRADISKTKRFFKRLQRLCKKYGYTVGEIQTTDKEGDNGKV